MKDLKWTRTAAPMTTALLLHMSISAKALDAWQTVDTYPDLQNQQWFGGSGRDIGMGQNGLLYSVGLLNPDTTGDATAIVRVSGDQGLSWTTLDASAYSGEPNPWTYACFLGFASDASGGFYVGGQLYNPLGQSGWPESGWVARESHDGGTTWTTTEIFQPVDAPYSWCSALKVAPWGDVFAAGLASPVATNSQGSYIFVNPSWMVRKRTFDASRQSLSAFATVDTVTTDYGVTTPHGIGFFAKNGVIVVGINDGMYWTVRLSTDTGATWATVDYLTTSNGWTGGVAENVAVDSHGTIYVVGQATQAPGHRSGTTTPLWLVRQSKDSGATWTTVDSFTYSSGTTPHAIGITFDGTGNPVVCGYVTTSNSDHWVVRRQTTTTTYVKQGKKVVPVTTVSWVTSDDWQLTSGQSAVAGDMTCDTSGNLYVTGKAIDGSGLYHWITRKLTATP